MPQLTTLPVSLLLAAFRSSNPTPGGGSAAALAGAVGASLLAMVAALGKPRTPTQEDAARLETSRERCAALAIELEALIDRDSAAYEMVVSAYRLPRDTDVERRARAARIQEAMRAAIEAPLGVMRACAAATGQSAVVATLGNANASSDVQVGIELLAAGLRGAKANVEINLTSAKDPDYVREVTAEVARLEQILDAGLRAASQHVNPPRKEPRGPTPASGSGAAGAPIASA